jgi:DNA mismatch repair protein MutS2
MARAAVRTPITVGGLDEGAAILVMLGPEGIALPSEDLLDLFVLLERSEEARRAVTGEGLDLPDLFRLVSPLVDFDDLLAERTRTFETDGRIRDTASTRLAGIRGSIIRLRREIVRRLEEEARSRPDLLEGGYVTEKGGRYCLPVRADRREGLAGIVHERSGSGQTLFVEPLAIVDANNSLAEATEDEREEVHRILVALTGRFSVQRSALGESVRVLSELDAGQARAEFSLRIEGSFPAFSNRLALYGARHPLLDRRLQPLREEIFGERPEERSVDAVPLDLVLPEEKRLLVLSGPNAGGKSVAMKTVGLLALMAQSGFALPVLPGSTLPIFDQILVVAGDAQDLLEGLSSFAASMTRTARVLRRATANSLVLLDELGSGTDPDEGAALAIAVLEQDIARKGFTVATTHLSAVKEWAHLRPEILAAAMEFDEREGKPTFRIRAGAIGRSRALSVAARAGLSESILARARERLGSNWAAADAALDRLEGELQKARADREDAAAAKKQVEQEVARLDEIRKRLDSERAQMRDKARLAIDRAIEAVRERTRRELERIREETRSGRALSRGALTTLLQTARDEAEIWIGNEPVKAGEVAVGDPVRIEPFRTTGRVLKIDTARKEAEVDASGKRMRVSLGNLVRIAAPDQGKKSPRPPAGTSLSSAPAPEIPRDLVLVGLRIDAALPEVERALNDALISGKGTLRVVHGYGTGRLSAAVREFLSEHPGVASFRPGNEKEGGEAVTIVIVDV